MIALEFGTYQLIEFFGDRSVSEEAFNVVAVRSSDGKGTTVPLSKVLEFRWSRQSAT